MDRLSADSKYVIELLKLYKWTRYVIGNLKAFNKITLMETYVVDESINRNDNMREVSEKRQ